jgi:hypothetical protein
MSERVTEQKVESQEDSTSINTHEFRRQVREEIGSLREKVDLILEALNVKKELKPDPEVIMKEMHQHSPDGEDFIRCAIIALIGGEEYSRSAYTILTTRVDNIFDNPNTTPEKVATFLSQLADPHRIDVCRRTFQGYRSRSELKAVCNLTDDELDSALQPLLEWEFLRWEDEEDEPRLHDEGPGIRFIIPLIFLTQESCGRTPTMHPNWGSLTGTGSSGEPPQK